MIAKENGLDSLFKEVRDKEVRGFFFKEDALVWFGTCGNPTQNRADVYHKLAVEFSEVGAIRPDFNGNYRNPDPPILAFFDFLVFFVFRFPLRYLWVFSFSFTRILGVPCLFSGFPLLFFFFKKARVGGSGKLTQISGGARHKAGDKKCFHHLTPKPKCSYCERLVATDSRKFFVGVRTGERTIGDMLQNGA